MNDSFIRFIATISLVSVLSTFTAIVHFYFSTIIPMILLQISRDSLFREIVRLMNRWLLIMPLSYARHWRHWLQPGLFMVRSLHPVYCFGPTFRLPTKC